jgi:CPA1 family monovalent cation:H+ antiporter
MSDVETILALLVAVAVLATLADRFRLPYPVLLVVGGAALGLVPGLPLVQLAPDVVFVVFVPPLVFAAAFLTSWRDFVANARPIMLLAVGLVVATVVLVAVAAHVGIGGIPWAPACVLGAVVSNTDTTAIVAIADRVRLPRRILTILEGESLVNDAVGLTAFRLAVTATVTGAFSPWSVGGQFLLAFAGAIPIGLAVGWLSTAARVRLDDPRIVIIVGLISPYAAYLPADQLGASGILAVVIAGLYVGRREARIEGAETRLQARAVWDLLTFVVNGLLFILVGIQLRPIWEALPSHRPSSVLGDAALVGATVVVVRIVWVTLSAAIPRWLGLPSLALPTGTNWRRLAIVAWAGLRGGDTLAAALAVPLVTDSGAPFPARPQIVWLAFVVIVVTLGGQGLTLPALIRRLGVVGDDAQVREERLARRAATEAALSRLDELKREDGVPAALVDGLRRRYEHRMELLGADESAKPSVAEHVEVHQRLQREVLGAEHAAILRLRDEGAIGDDVLREVERELDLEAARIEG